MDLRERVRIAYSRVAADPHRKHPFPCGEEFARNLGYPAEILGRLPKTVKESFSGVSNVSIFAQIFEGSTVLDLGCGTGLDSFIAAFRTGPKGRVIGIDFSSEMVEKGHSASRSVGLENIHFSVAEVEKLPVPPASLDTVLVNGIFNLNPRRAEIFRELGRVVRPGGRIFAAEFILRQPLSEAEKTNEENWFA